MADNEKDWVEFRACCIDGQPCAYLSSGATGQILQEDFDHHCLVCPVTGYKFDLDQVMESFRQARPLMLALVETMRDAQAKCTKVG